MSITKNQIKFIRQLEQKKFRRREGLFVAEGTKVVGDLLTHYRPHSIFATPEWLAGHQSSCQSSAPLIQEVTPEELRRISFLQHPQQVLALFPLPSSSSLTISSSLPISSSSPPSDISPSPFLLICKYLFRKGFVEQILPPKPLGISKTYLTHDYVLV